MKRGVNVTLCQCPNRGRRPDKTECKHLQPYLERPGAAFERPYPWLDFKSCIFMGLDLGLGLVQEGFLNPYPSLIHSADPKSAITYPQLPPEKSLILLLFMHFLLKRFLQGFTKVIKINTLIQKRINLSQMSSLTFP